MFFSIHRAMMYTLALAQVFGQFPVKGILSADSSKLSFRWCSIRLLYYVAVWIGHILYLYLTWTSVFIHFREPNGSISALSNSTLLRRAGPPVFNILFLKIAHKWTGFVQKWEVIEGKMILRQNSSYLQRYVKLSTVFFTSFRLVSYAVGNIVTVVRVMQCLHLTSLSHLVDIVFYVRYPQIMVMAPSVSWVYLTLSLLDVCAACSWLCVELLILNLSLLLLDKFRVYNNHLQGVKTKSSSVKFWQMMRREFQKLSLLSELTDSVLSPMIFTIVILQTMNMILQLYIMLTHSFTKLSYLYFVIVIGSHLASDCWTLVTMASVFDESRRPLQILQLLPTSHTSVQTKRLYTEIKFSTNGLTGCKFFIVTRSFTLSIISTLVTYEVLLVQLGGFKHEGSSQTTNHKNSTTNSMEYCSWIKLYLQTRA